MSPDGKIVISSEEGGPFRAFTLGSDGKLTQGPNSPLSPPASLYPPGFDPKLKWALGLGVHPTQKIMYAQMATINKMAVFRYDDQARLTFVKAVPNQGGQLPCWTLVNRAGTRIYTDNAANNTMTVYDISDPLNPKQIQVLKLKNDREPLGRPLRPDRAVHLHGRPARTRQRDARQRPGVHSLTVAADGAQRAHGPAPIPVELNTNPIGMAVGRRQADVPQHVPNGLR